MCLLNLRYALFYGVGKEEEWEIICLKVKPVLVKIILIKKSKCLHAFILLFINTFQLVCMISTSLYSKA